MIVEDEIEKDFFQTKTIATFLREHCTRNDWKLTEWLKTQSKGRNNFKCHTDSLRLLSLDTSSLRVTLAASNRSFSSTTIRHLFYSSVKPIASIEVPFKTEEIPAPEFQLLHS